MQTDHKALGHDYKKERMCKESNFLTSCVTEATIICYLLFIWPDNFSTCSLPVITFLAPFALHEQYVFVRGLSLYVNIAQLFSKFEYFVMGLHTQILRETTNLWVWAALTIRTPYPKSQVH